jgi:mitochondrial fission protein ELM1
VISWLSNKKETLADIWVVSDSSHRCQQAIALANHLDGEYKVIEAEEITADFIKKHTAPTIIIGAGKACAEPILLVKQLAKKAPYTAMILDPQECHDAFDVIIVPDYEPHYIGSNTQNTIGLLSKITTANLFRAKEKFLQGVYPDMKAAITKQPLITVLVGGKYIGGDYTPEDVLDLCEKINSMVEKMDGFALVSTCGRTDRAVTQMLMDNLTIPHFLYDFQNYRHMKNPYKAMLTLADEIVVMGDSIRMCCEASATTKPVHIVEPTHDFRPFQALYDQLYS